MNNTFKFVGLLAVYVVLLLACNKEAAIDEVHPANGQLTDTPGVSYTSGEILTSFSAKFENGLKTKVGINIGDDKASLSFKTDDEVLVVSGTASASYKYDGNEFVAVDTPITLSTSVSVYYPVSEFTFDGTNVVFTMPAAVTDIADLGVKVPLAAQLTGSDTEGYTATFKAVASVLQVNVTGTMAISGVKLQNAGGSRMPLGPDAQFTVGWAGTEPTMSANESATKAEMSISRNVTLSDTPQIFYYIVPAGVAYTDVSVQAQFSSGTIGGLSIFTVSRGNWTAARNNVYTMSFYAGLFSGGTGTDADPYKIANARDFKNISKYCSEGYGVGPDAVANTAFLAAYYRQTADIDFKKVKMSPIGDSDNRFAGIYDGNGKELQNVKIEETGQFAGVFAYAEGDNALIKDLTVSGSVTKTGTTSTSCVGSIVGIVRGGAIVSGCTNNATVTSSATYTGGIAGRLYNSTADEGISNCINNGTVTASTTYAGGIVGQQTGGGRVSGCTNNGAISGTDAVGGIVGYLISGTIGSNDGIPTTAEEGASYAENGCANTGAITGTKWIGGIVGQMGNGLLSICRNAGDVSCTNENAGGIVGYLQGGTIRLCYSKNAITISGPHQVGGIVGYAGASSPIVIINSSAKSNVTSTAYVDKYFGAAGGLIGHMKSTASNNCVLANSVAWASNIMNTANANAYVGGIVGRISGASKKAIVRNCYSMHNGAANSTNGLLGYKIGDGALKFGEYCGGVFGYLENGEVDDCYWTKYNLVTSAGKQTSTTNDKSVTNVKDMSNAAKNGTEKFATSAKYKNGRSNGTQFLYEHLRRGSFSTSDGNALFNYTGFTQEYSCAWSTKSNFGATSNKDNAIPVVLGYLPRGVDGWWQE